MAGIRVTITGDDTVNRRLGGMKRYIVRAVNAPTPSFVSPSAVNESLNIAKKVFAQPSNGPKYPIRWKSRRQQIAVIIKLRKEGNLPYRRTGQFNKAWEATTKPNLIEISNTANEGGKFIAHFLIGDFQQPFHADTGYKKRSESIEKQIIKPITDDILKRAKEGLESSNNG